MLYLKNERLYVEIPDPGEMPNHTFRFDRAGFISQVVLDGKCYFCTSEPKILAHPSSGGRGICSELICDCDLEFSPGEYFPKFGIGLLKKDDDKPYLFHKKYEEKPFVIHVDREGDDRVVFTTEPMPCGGYALAQKKTVRLQDNTIVMTHELENTGEKHISLREYNHNMFSLDELAIGPDYEIELPDIRPLPEGVLPEAFEGYAQNFVWENGRMHIRRYTDIASVYAMPQEYLTDAPQFRWNMINKKGHVAIEAVDGFKPVQVNFWTVDHVCSVESFKGVELEPGQKEVYERRWSFVCTL